MKRINRFSSIAAILVVLLLVGCEAKSPTAPQPGGTPGTPPPTSASVSVVVSNASPIVNSTSTITATVTMGSSPVADGTAVEFSTDLGTFTDTTASSTIKTTSSGVASAIVTSSTVGTATLTIRVNNVVKTTSVTFKDQSDTNPTGPVIASFDPATGKPSGGDIVVIKGSNFESPVRVLFGDTPAVVASSTSTEIHAVAPPIDLSLNEQARDVSIIVISAAGTSSEQTATSPSTYRYVLDILTPHVVDVSPSSGPNSGNTRITIVGDGFQAPAKVFFGSAGGSTGPLTDQVEATVLQVTYNQIIAMTPPATGLGAPLANLQTTLRVLNVQSGTDTVVANAFRYGPGMQINSVGPTEGSAAGGTQVTIDGWGFSDPVAVVIGGVAAQPIRVSGTQIVAVTSPPNVTSCADITGPVSVTNVNDGTSAEGGTFTYRVAKSAITAVSPANVVEGGTVQVTVSNPGTGAVRFDIGGVTRLPSSAIPVTGGTKYTIVAPTSLTFVTEACGTNGTQQVGQAVDVTFTNTSTACTDTLTGAVVVLPTDITCHEVAIASVAPATLTFGSVASGGGTQDLPVSITNTGGGTLSVLNGAADTGDFSVVGASFPVNLGAGDSASFTIRFAPVAAGDASGTITFTTNVGDVTVSVSGTGT